MGGRDTHVGSSSPGTGAELAVGKVLCPWLSCVHGLRPIRYLGRLGLVLHDLGAAGIPQFTGTRGSQAFIVCSLTVAQCSDHPRGPLCPLKLYLLSLGLSLTSVGKPSSFMDSASVRGGQCPEQALPTSQPFFQGNLWDSPASPCSTPWLSQGDRPSVASPGSRARLLSMWPKSIRFCCSLFTFVKLSWESVHLRARPGFVEVLGKSPSSQFLLQ